MRFLPLLALLVVVGCGADSLEPVAEQAQAASFFYGAHNNGTNINVPATRYCHNTRASASNGHASSATWPNGIAKYGAIFDGMPTWIQATPFSTSWGGDAVLALTCEDFSNFSFGAAASQSSNDFPFYLSWGPSSGQNPVQGTRSDLWNFPASFCYLNSFHGFGSADEEAGVYPPANWSGNWSLGVYGYAEISGVAKCVFPDRAWTYHGPTYASPGSPAVGPATGNSVCAMRKIRGNLDDGSVQISASGGNWVMTVTGGVSAEMSCMVF